MLLLEMEIVLLEAVELGHDIDVSDVVHQGLNLVVHPRDLDEELGVHVPLQLVGELLVAFDLVHGPGHVVLLLTLLLLVMVHQHLDELVVHDLHVDLILHEGLEHLAPVLVEDPCLVLDVVQGGDVLIVAAGPSHRAIRWF